MEQALDPLTVKIALVFVHMALTGVVSFQVWLFKRTAANEKGLLEYKLEVANTYAKDSEIKELLQRMDRKLDQVIRDTHKR